MGCYSIPDNVLPVEGFESERYLGKWYEVARLENSFERGLTNIQAEYLKNSDGSIKVVNKGFDPFNKRWKEAIGRASFVTNSSIGRLKVSFFWPFYGGYNIIDLDKENYSYALVCGANKEYLWVLSRTPQLEPDIQSKLIKKALKLGFRTEELIFVDHSAQD